MKILLAILILAGCASIPQPVQDVATSSTTFGICKAADVATTMYALNTHIGVEANPLLKPFIGAGHFFPLIVWSYGLYLVVDRYANKPTTTVANAITCGVALHNLLLIK